MSESLLNRAGLNAVIVGDGAIGSALRDELLKRSNLGALVVLSRKQQAAQLADRSYHQPIDLADESSISLAAERASEQFGKLHLLINTVGVLHNERLHPEKRLRDISLEGLLESFQVNAALLPVLAQGFGGLLKHDEPSILASLSARVGSIADNRLGGWYAYRASKAAHNMLLKNIALEWRVSHRRSAVIALHPGTVQSRLSEPFITAAYKNRVLTPPECAHYLLSVIDRLTPADSGGFFDWQGDAIPW
ncbi:MAG: SDR family NAD(P)-dependent oxidoreductase [Pseudomonadota bacterium]